MTAKEYNEHVFNYDKAGVIANELVVDEYWDKCYCSTLPRAMTTAKTIYHGEIILTDKLVEIPVAAMFNANFKLPYHVWAILGRIAWIRNHLSQPESRNITLKRVNEIIESILKENDPKSNVLIVSHAGTLYEVQKILRNKGFKGKGFIKASNGKLYIYDK
jgi:broad specificity phosphatase PhoE